MATPEELLHRLEAIQTRFTAEGLSPHVRGELEAIEEALVLSRQENPDVDYDDISDDIVDFSIFAFGGCY